MLPWFGPQLSFNNSRRNEQTLLQYNCVMLADQVHLDHAFALSNSNHETMSPPIITRGCPELQLNSKRSIMGIQRSEIYKTGTMHTSKRRQTLGRRLQ